MPSYLVVDSGTTTTRVRLVREGAVVRSREQRVGARDTAVDGDNRRLKDALGAMLGRFASEETDLEAVLLSGMITSNVGLLEVPHLTAPASLDALARGVLRRDFPELSRLPFYFVRGVRTMGAERDLAGFDVLRGEEAEVVGLRELLGIAGSAVFVHYGSHHKAVDVAADGTFLASRTALTGELLAAVREHTILSSSVEPLERHALDADAWREGMAAAAEHGLGRALFLVRVGEQIGGRSKAAMTSFLLGALAGLDLPLLQLSGDGARAVVLYGRGPFKTILRDHLSETAGVEAVVVDDATAEAAAVVGAVALFRRARELEEAR